MDGVYSTSAIVLFFFFFSLLSVIAYIIAVRLLPPHRGKNVALRKKRWGGRWLASGSQAASLIRSSFFYVVHMMKDAAVLSTGQSLSVLSFSRRRFFFFKCQLSLSHNAHRGLAPGKRETLNGPFLVWSFCSTATIFCLGFCNIGQLWLK